jgi:hypothetical protein
VIFLYAFISLIFDSLLGAFRDKNPFILDIFALVEFGFFSVLLYLCIKNTTFKKSIIAISVANLCFEFYLLFAHKSSFEFWVALTTAVLIVIYSIFFFYEEINSTENLLIYQSYRFWMIVGCIIYLSGTLFLFLLTSDIKDKQNSPSWIINILSEIIKNVFFSIAFIVARNNRQIDVSQEFDDTNILEKPF